MWRGGLGLLIALQYVQGVKNICNQPAVITKMACFGYFPRYTFSSSSGHCERIVYGGCGGSENLFLSLSECRQSCETGVAVPRTSLNIDISFPSPKKGEDICSLPPLLPGPMACMALIPKWTFSSEEGGCVEYMYGGCRGTDNLFDTKEECQQKCQDFSNRKTAEVCSLPISPGPCRLMSFSPSYGFNSATSRCEAFSYGGCRGNENRFSTVEECTRVCGGVEPLLVTNKCPDVKCDEADSIFQRAKGCVPLTKPEDCCPYKWDCSNWERRLSNRGQCFFSSSEDPAGRFYKAGDIIPAVSDVNGCNQACRCSLPPGSTDAEIVCATVDCHSKLPKGKSRDACRATYGQLNECCPSKYSCDVELESLSTCKLDGETFYEGEKMYPKSDSCKVCHCTKGWNGELSDTYCETVDCGLQLYHSKLIQGCQPIFTEGSCCPVDWLCPDQLSPVSPLKITSPPAPPSDGSKSASDSDRCLLPKDSGPCKKLSPPQFYFDITTRQCLSFSYGGCRGNENRFDLLEDCVSSCEVFMSSNKEEVPVDDKRCEEPKKPGVCRGYQQRWWHNKETGGCEQFIFTGCQGNENNFESPEDCEVACRVTKQSIAGKDPICNSEVKIGSCRSRLEKYYYDQQSGTCKLFLYSGCQGGENMFDTISQCVQSCLPQTSMELEPLARSLEPQKLFLSDPCEQDKTVGPCRRASPRWFYNKATSACEEFLYGGCRGNENNFESSEACSSRCATKSPLIQVGSARTLPHPLHDDDGLDGVDEDDVIVIDISVPTAPRMPMPGGFGASQPIDTKETKMVAGKGAKLLNGVKEISDCPTVQLVAVKDVKRQVVAGTNFQFTLRLSTWTGPNCDVKSEETCSGIFFHRPLGCKEDDYSNCLELIRNDDINCKGKDDIEDPCLLDKVVGRCRARLLRYFFDQAAGSCTQFYFGGCQGNGNNFKSLEECQQVCESRTTRVGTGMDRVPRLNPVSPDSMSVCGEAQDSGPCFAFSPRFSYNSDSGTCESFVFGGCRGNRNNFHTERECWQRCGTNKRAPRTSPYPPFPPPLPRCNLGNESYAIGDTVKAPGSPCRTCVCSSPPSLTCQERVCPLKAFLPPPGGDNCVLEKDADGCCEVGYSCQHVSPPAPPPLLGGGGSLLGGYRKEALGGEVKKLAAVATKSLLSLVKPVGGNHCSHAQLLEILEVARQLVQGTHFKLKLRIRTKTGDNCEIMEEKICSNIVIFRPLPVYCEEESGECLKVTKEEDIVCKSESS